jgi:hypothetical protein
MKLPMPKSLPKPDDASALFVRDRELHRRVCPGGPAGGIGRQFVDAWDEPTRNQRREVAR